jgi:lysophospholipase L1-like esterase
MKSLLLRALGVLALGAGVCLSTAACDGSAERSAAGRFVPRAAVVVPNGGRAVPPPPPPLPPADPLADVQCQVETRPDPTRWKAQVEWYQGQDKAKFPEPGGIVFVGSSSIRLWKTLEHDMAPLPALRRGLGGAVIADATHYADKMVAPYDPGMVVIYAGENDIAEGLAPGCVARDFQKFVARLRTLGVSAPVYYVSMKPSPKRMHLWPRMQEANALVKRAIGKDDSLHFVDMTEVMISQDGNVRQEFFKDDRLHMNEEGYRAWTDRLKPVLLRRS